jgi:hypothetical protein
MTYLLDANVFITAKNDYYAFDLVPAFWPWLEEQTENGTVDTVTQVRAEILSGREDDPLRIWVEGLPRLGREPDDATVDAMRKLARWVTTTDRYRGSAVNEFLRSADYYLIADAFAHGDTVVTLETARTQSKRSVKIPDVCAAFDVPVLRTFEMLRAEGASFSP